MSTTPRMYFPEIAASQSQKEVTHNESLQMLDSFMFCAVQDKDLVNPPSTSDGISYIVAVGGASTWTGQDNNIAQRYNSGWTYYTPSEGWRAWVKDEDLMYIFSSSSWNALVDITRKVQTVTVTSSTISVDWRSGHKAKLTIDRHCVIKFSGASEGDRPILELRQASTGGWTITLSTSEARYGYATTGYTASTGALQTDYVELVYNGTTGYYDVVGVFTGYGTS